MAEQNQSQHDDFAVEIHAVILSAPERMATIYQNPIKTI
jgi:hypothetical protein